MRITALEPQKDAAGRLSVHVDGELRLGLAAEVALAAGLRVGDEVTEERLAELEAQDDAWRAREAALSLLTYRSRSAAELRRRLGRKGFDPEVAGRTVERMRELGVVDDAAFAETFVRDRVRRRPKGKRRLADELRAKGVDAETARAAVDEVLEREDATELDLARQAAAKWRPQPGEEPARARRRLHGFLARRGFAGETVRQVMEEVLGDEEPEAP
jgi:regulatory protein